MPVQGGEPVFGYPIGHPEVAAVGDFGATIRCGVGEQDPVVPALDGKSGSGCPGKLAQYVPVADPSRLADR
ncbi:hypothetical protein ACLMAJ_32250 [Nocardia sp. KC 131]|uniref:hypothetical protein n=1 Tax=Nocardia arseniciresistens TaxID=3392119 RepID=UPI00398E3F87